MGSKKVVYEALQTTSLKVVPRLLKASGIFLKALWTVALLCFLTMCFLQASQNLQEFLSFDTVIMIEEEVLDLERQHRHLFPNMMLCNKNPFGGNLTAFSANGVEYPDDYFDMVKKVLRCSGDCNLSGFSQEDLAIAKSMTYSSSGFYQYVEKDKASLVGHQHLVVDCMAVVAHASAKYLMPCDSHITVNKVTNPFLFNCYVYEPKNAYDKELHGMIFVLHINSDLNNPFRILTSHSLPPKGAGAWLTLVPRGSAPTIDEKSVSIAPGFETFVPFSIYETERLVGEHSKIKCQNVNEGKDIFNLDYNYTWGVCKGECVRKHVAEECACNNVEVIDYPETRHSDLPYCFSIKNKTRDQFLENVKCHKSIIKKAFQECHKICKVPCHEIGYGTKATLSKWPLQSQFGDFYETYIENSSFAKIYENYTETFRKIKQGETQSISDTEFLKLTHLIESNFAQVAVMIGNGHVTKYVEKQKLTLSSFVSQLGGTLNLWAGITFVVFVEIIDLIYKLVVNMRERKVQKDTSKETQVI